MNMLICIIRAGRAIHGCHITKGVTNLDLHTKMDLNLGTTQSALCFTSVTKALWTPPVWLWARKISAVDCDLTNLLCCANLWILFPSGRVWKTSSWMESPPPSNHKYWMEFFKLSLSLKVTCGGGDIVGGNQTPTSSFRKVEPRVLAINSKTLRETRLGT